MNHHQKQYALKRIQDVQKLKLDEARVKLEVKEKRLPDNERIDLIYKNKVNLLPRKNIYDYTDLADAYDFSEYEIKRSFKKEYEPLVKKINKFAQDAKDQIMLGDCDEALKIIQQLESINI